MTISVRGVNNLATTAHSAFGQMPAFPNGKLLADNPPVVSPPPVHPSAKNIGKDLLSRLKGAVTRPIRMLMRPIGVLELFVHLIPGFQWVSIPLIVSKHAFEGFFRVDGIFGKRDWAKLSPFNITSGARQHGRSFLDLLKGRPEHWEQKLTK